MRLNYFVFLSALLIAISALLHKHASGEAATTFGNMTYFTGNEYGTEATALVNGVHEEAYLNVRYDNKYVRGDFNHDGLKDAAVIIVENNGGNAEWYILAFLINDGKSFVHKASRELDDRAVINSIKENKGRVVVDMFVHKEGDCMGGPSRRVKNIYNYLNPDLDVVAPLWAKFEKIQ